MAFFSWLCCWVLSCRHTYIKTCMTQCCATYSCMQAGFEGSLYLHQGGRQEVRYRGFQQCLPSLLDQLNGCCQLLLRHSMPPCCSSACIDAGRQLKCAQLALSKFSTLHGMHTVGHFSCSVARARLICKPSAALCHMIDAAGTAAIMVVASTTTARAARACGRQQGGCANSDLVLRLRQVGAF